MSNAPLWARIMPVAETAVETLFLFSMQFPEADDHLQDMKEGILFLIGLSYLENQSVQEQSTIAVNLFDTGRKGGELLSEYIQRKN